MRTFDRQILLIMHFDAYSVFKQLECTTHMADNLAEWDGMYFSPGLY